MLGAAWKMSRPTERPPEAPPGTLTAGISEELALGLALEPHARGVRVQPARLPRAGRLSSP
eukprot:8435268-Alexandrium_andersonii.AAC.1